MGCGMSTLAPEEAAAQYNSPDQRRHGHGRNVSDGYPIHSEKVLENGKEDDEGDYFSRIRKSSAVSCHDADEGYNEDHDIEDGADGETFHDDRQNIARGIGSPSFREYCVDSRDLGLNEAKSSGKADVDAQGGSLTCEKVEGSKSAEPNKRSTRKGFKSPIPMPAWIGKSKKSI